MILAIVRTTLYGCRMTTFIRTAFISGMCVFMAAALLARASQAAPPVQTKRQAELNILRTPRYFWRVGLHGFIHSRTKTFRTNVTVTCAGGRGPGLRAHVFVCSLRYRGKAATVKYTALGKYAFRLRVVRAIGA